MLTDAQIESLADMLNAKVNIPLIGEGTERQILVAALKQLNTVLAGKAGEELRGIIGPLVSGSATPEEAVVLRSRAVEHLNKHVNLPVVGEGTEAQILAPVVDGIVDVTRKKLG